MKHVSLALLFVVTLFGPAKAQDVGPGDIQPDAATVITMFDMACVNNLPDFTPTEQLLENSGVFQQADTGTYYHTSFDLSIKVHISDGDLVCSVVFFNNSNVAGISADLNAAMDRTRSQYGSQHPTASFEVLTADGDSTGFHRLAIFMISN